MSLLLYVVAVVVVVCRCCCCCMSLLLLTLCFCVSFVKLLLSSGLFTMISLKQLYSADRALLTSDKLLIFLTAWTTPGRVSQTAKMLSNKKLLVPFKLL